MSHNTSDKSVKVTWKSMNQGICQDKKCEEELAKLNKQTLMAFDDIEFLFVHCVMPKCHDISPGSASFECDDCEKWFCQHHEWSKNNFNQNNFICDTCLRKSMKK